MASVPVGWDRRARRVGRGTVWGVADLDDLFGGDSDGSGDRYVPLPPGIRLPSAGELQRVPVRRGHVEPSAYLCSPLGGFSRLCALVWSCVALVAGSRFVGLARHGSAGPLTGPVVALFVLCGLGSVVWVARVSANVEAFGVFRRRRSWWGRVVPPWALVTAGSLVLDLWRGAHPGAVTNAGWDREPVPLALWSWTVLVPAAAAVTGLSATRVLPEVVMWGLWTLTAAVGTIAIERVRWRHHRRALSVGYGAVRR